MVLKNAPISGSLRMFLDVCLYMSFQRFLYLDAYIFLTKDTSGSPQMLLSVCLYYTLQGCPSKYTYICMSNDAPLCMAMLGSLYVLLYMPMLWFASIPNSRYTYVILKNTPLCIPVSFSVVLLLNIYLY